MTKRAVIYARQSLESQEGIDRQLERCRALAAAKGWEVVEELVDNGVSASKARDNAEWARLVDGARAGGWDVVIAAKLDRLARQVRDVLDLSDLGLGIVTLEGDIDTTTDVGRFQATLLASLAELEASRKGTRHREAHQSRADKGIPRITKRPYGWQADGIHLEPVEAEHLREAITNIVAGKSVAGEARRMTEAGQRTPLYRSGSGGEEITPRRLVSMLDRPRIAGINTYQGVETALSVIEPVVDRETWDEYRAIRQDPLRLSRAPGRSPLQHWLSGVPLCPCGEPLRASTAQGRGKRYRYYRCVAKGPGHVGINAELLELKTARAVYEELGHRRGDVADHGEIRRLRQRRSETAERIEYATEVELRARTASARKAARREVSALEDEYGDIDESLTQALNAAEAEDWSQISSELLAIPDDYDAFRPLATALNEGMWTMFCARWNLVEPARRREITSRLLYLAVLPAPGRRPEDRIVIKPRT